MRHDRGNTLTYQDNREGLRALPLKAMECEIFCYTRGQGTCTAVGAARGCPFLCGRESHHDHSPIAQGKTMAEPQETQQEKETRWADQRAAHDTQQQASRAARARTRGRNWLVVGAIVIIVAVIAAAMLL